MGSSCAFRLVQAFCSFPSEARVVTKVFLFFTWHLEKVAISLGSLYPNFDFFVHTISFSRGQGEADVLDVALVGKMGQHSLVVLSAVGEAGGGSSCSPPLTAQGMRNQSTTPASGCEVLAFHSF